MCVPSFMTLHPTVVESENLIGVGEQSGDLQSWEASSFMAVYPIVIKIFQSQPRRWGQTKRQTIAALPSLEPHP